MKYRCNRCGHTSMLASEDGSQCEICNSDRLSLYVDEAIFVREEGKPSFAMFNAIVMGAFSLCLVVAFILAPREVQITLLSILRIFM